MTFNENKVAVCSNTVKLKTEKNVCCQNIFSIEEENSSHTLYYICILHITDLPSVPVRVTGFGVTVVVCELAQLVSESTFMNYLSV